jgi:hypothetical protein
MNKMNKIEKPQKTKRSAYDYNECSNYLQKKYGYNERDYAGKHKYWNVCKRKTNKKFGNNGWYDTKPADMTPEQTEAHQYYNELLSKEPEYQDFWHFIIENYEIHNGCYFIMTKDLYEKEIKDWQKEILGYFFDEFDPKNTGEIEFFVCW